MSIEMERRINVVTLWIARGAVAVACTIGLAYMGQVKDKANESMESIRVDFKEMKNDFKDVSKLVDQHEAKINQQEKAIDRLDRQKADKR